MTDTEKHIEENEKFWDNMPVEKRTELDALAMKCMASECHPPRLPKMITKED